MAERSARSASADGPAGPQEPEQLRAVLRSPGYRKALIFSGLIGIPVSLAAFWLLAALHELEHLFWSSLPRALGWDTPPAWWPLPLLLIAGIVVGAVVTRLRGAGGHVPAGGLHAGAPAPAALPGVVLAAASLPLGAVLGPEAPLIALGGGLALLFRDLARAPATPRSNALLGAAGAAAAVSAIFGNPLVAAVLLIEVAGVGGPQLVAVMLPALLSSGVGSLIFTGLGRWTGLKTGSLGLDIAGPVPRLDIGDVLWAVVLGVVVGALVRLAVAGGRLTAAFVAARPFRRTVACAVAAGGCATLYSVTTGRSPAEAALSGQATLAHMASAPAAWGIGALLALLVFKTAAYALCLGSLRGGPIFPALCLGGAAGLLLSPLPGLGVVPGTAAGMAAAAVSALRLPVSSVVLVVLLLGSPGMTPVVILAAVVAFVTTELMPTGPALEPAAGALSGRGDDGAAAKG
ncbi:chloride channel protein [Streptomyces sp. NPDC048389]|uniref:chloride channel protein n=1 Tax=Streptomyces sp. NPDC048389 TaxID=3154622 RepID=UPI0034563E9D